MLVMCFICSCKYEYNLKSYIGSLQPFKLENASDWESRASYNNSAYLWRLCHAGLCKYEFIIVYTDVTLIERMFTYPISPRSRDPFYIVNCNLKWVNTSGSMQYFL